MRTTKPESLQRITEQALGEETIGIRRPTEGAVAETVLLTLAGGREVVCKIGGENIWTGEVIEPSVAKFVKEHTSLPVPSVLATGEIRKSGKRKRWALYEKLPGLVPRDVGAEAKESIVASAGRLLGQLHASFCFDGIGGLVRDGDGLRKIPPTSRNLLCSTPVALLRGRYEPSRFVLSHGDYQPGNLLTDGREVTGVLDWGNAHITDVTYAVARAELRFIDLTTRPGGKRLNLRETFRNAYAATGPFTDLAIDHFTAYKLLWLFQSARNLAGVAKTRRGVGQLRRQLTRWLTRTSKSIFCWGHQT